MEEIEEGFILIITDRLEEAITNQWLGCNYIAND